MRVGCPMCKTRSITVTDVLDNQAPTDLNSTATLQVYENQIIGSLIGVFNASDPDGDPLTFSLVGGTGDNHNASFLLDANGTLTTAVIFDYEAGATRSIRVEARGNQNVGIEAIFEVMIGLMRGSGNHFKRFRKSGSGGG